MVTLSSVTFVLIILSATSLAKSISEEDPIVHVGGHINVLSTAKKQADTAESSVYETRIPAPASVSAGNQWGHSKYMNEGPGLLEHLAQMAEASEQAQVQTNYGAPAAQYGAPAAQYGAPLQHPSDVLTMQQLVRKKQLEQQKLLNLQYQLQQQKEQYQMRQELELKRLRQELLEEKKLLQQQKQPISNYGAPLVQNAHSEVYGAPLALPPVLIATPGPSTAYGAPGPSIAYGAPGPSTAYGAPAGVPHVQTTEVHTTNTHTEAVEPEEHVLVCDEREAVGKKRIIEVRTSHGALCKVTVQAFDRCPDTEPVSFLVESMDPHHPEACRGVENFLRAKKFLTNTASRIPGQLLGVAQYAVDTFDIVRDFYTHLYHQRQQEKLAPQVFVPLFGKH